MYFCTYIYTQTVLGKRRTFFDTFTFNERYLSAKLASLEYKLSAILLVLGFKTSTRNSTKVLSEDLCFGNQICRIHRCVSEPTAILALVVLVFTAQK